MWVPTSLEDIDLAIADGSLFEHSAFDAKRELPAAGKNLDLAKAVAAMSVDGGVLVYGLDEDGADWQIVPIEGLSTARERIGQVVEHTVAGDLRIEVTPIPVGDLTADIGLIVVSVLPSSRAPHALRVKGGAQFWGRGPTGNRLLSPEEVDRLYERRQRWQVDRAALVSNAVSRLRDHVGGVAPGAFVVLAQPAVADRGLLRRLREPQPDGTLKGPNSTIWPLIERANQRCVNRGDFDPRLIHLNEWRPSPGGGFSSQMYYKEPNEGWDARRYLVFTIHGDGGVETRCLRGRGFLRRSTTGEEVWGVLEWLIAILTSQTLAIAGEALQLGGYFGPVDLGFSISGIKGLDSCYLTHKCEVPPPVAPPGFPEDGYDATERVSASELAADPLEVAVHLLGDFFRVTAGESADPFGMIRP